MSRRFVAAAPVIIALALLAVLSVASLRHDSGGYVYAAPLVVSLGPDLATTGGAICDSVLSGSTCTNAFDNSGSTSWTTNTTSANCAGVAYAGQDFGAGNAYEIREISLSQFSASQSTTAVVVQRSSDGVSWNSVQGLTLPLDTSVYYFDIVASGASRYWRILCAATAGGNPWRLKEVEMMDVEAWAATNTPVNTNTPPGTPTPSTTPSPTPNYYIEITSTQGPAMRLERSATFGDIYICGGIVLMGIIFFLAFVYRFWTTRAQ